MPVMRGSLRPSGDGSIKSFVIILTVIGFLCFIYYKLRLSPGCVVFIAEINTQRAEINRLTALVKNLDELIQNQKEENRKVVAQKNAKDQDLAAARAVEIDGLKQIAQLKNDLKVAGSKLESCGPAKDLGMSCTEMEEKYKQEIKDLKEMNLQLKIDGRNERKHDGAKEAPEYPQKELKSFTYKQNLPSDLDKQIFNKNNVRDSAKEERNELLNTVEFTSNNSSKSKINNNFEETLKPLKNEAEEKEEILKIPELKNLKEEKSKLAIEKPGYFQEERAVSDETVARQEPVHNDFWNKNQRPADNDEKQIEGKGRAHERIIGMGQKDSIYDQNKSLKDQSEYEKVMEGFKYEHEKDGEKPKNEQPAFGYDRTQNPSYNVREVKRRRNFNRGIVGNDSKRGRNRPDDDRQEAGLERDKNDGNEPKKRAKLEDEEIQQVPDTWDVQGQNDSGPP